MNIRNFENNDAKYRAIVNIHNLSFPENGSSLEAWKRSDETQDKQYLFQRIIAELDGEIVAVASYEEPWWTDEPNRYFIYIMVHPDHRCKGIGSALYDWIMQALSPPASTVLSSTTRSSQPDGVRFLETLSFHLAYEKHLRG